jgi:hypothetical protein
MNRGLGSFQGDIVGHGEIRRHTAPAQRVAFSTSDNQRNSTNVIVKFHCYRKENAGLRIPTICRGELGRTVGPLL